MYILTLSLGLGPGPGPGIGIGTKLPVQLTKLDNTHYLYTCWVALDRNMSSSYQLDISLWQEETAQGQGLGQRGALSTHFSFWLPAQDGPELQSKESAEPYRFLLMADNQNGPFKFSQLLNAAMASAPTTSAAQKQQQGASGPPVATAVSPPANLPYHALFHIGDAVQLPFKLYDWQCYFFDPLHRSGLAPSLPILFTPGNHDCSRFHQNFYTAMSQTWIAYSFGAARVIVLDSNRWHEREQIDWFHAQLASQACREAAFGILLVHMAPYIEYWDPRKWKAPAKEYLTSEATRRVLEEAKALFHQKHPGAAFPIDLVVSGHQHNYQRGRREDGITYTIIGGAGGELDREQVEHWQDMYKVTFIGHHYVAMTIHGRSELHWEARTEDGTTIDSMILHSNRVN